MAILSAEKSRQRAIKAVVFDFPKTILDSNRAYEGAWTELQGVYEIFRGFKHEKLIEVHDTAAEETWVAKVDPSPLSTKFEVIRSLYHHHKWATTCRGLGLLRYQIPDKEQATEFQKIYGNAISKHCREVPQSTIAVDELLRKGVEVGFFSVCLPFEHLDNAPRRMGFVAFKQTRHEVCKPADSPEEKMLHLSKAAGLEPYQPDASAAASTQGQKNPKFHDPKETVFIGVGGTPEIDLAHQIGMRVLYWDPELLLGITYRQGGYGLLKPQACSNMMSVVSAVERLSHYIASQKQCTF